MAFTIATIREQVDAIVGREIRDADEYLSARSELNGKLCTAQMVERDPTDMGYLELAFDQFNAMHADFAAIMRGACDSKAVLRAAMRDLTPPGENKPMSITPFEAEVYVSDWNGFVCLFDADVQYADVTACVRDVLLALTYAPRAVAYGTTLCMRFGMADGRFTVNMGGEKVDVLANGRCWADLVDIKRAKRMKKSARGAGCVLWTLLHDHRAVYEGGELMLNSERGDALRRAYNPATRIAGRNLAARARPAGRKIMA